MTTPQSEEAILADYFGSATGSGSGKKSTGSGSKTPRAKKPTKTELAKFFEQNLQFVNAGYAMWAGGIPERRLFVLTPAEISAEADALADIVLAYPVIYGYILAFEKGSPLFKLFYVNVMIVAMRMPLYQAMRNQDKSSAEVHSNMEEAPEPFGTAFNPQTATNGSQEPEGYDPTMLRNFSI